MFITTEQSGLESFEQLASLEQPIKFAAPGVGTASTIETTLLVKALNLPVQVVTGYNGNDDQLAMRRGEVEGMFTFRSSFQPFIDAGYGKFVAQVGGTQTDVPQLSEFTTDAAAQSAIALIASQSNIARLTAGPPGIPEDRLEALRDAYLAATSDPEFLAKAQALGLPVSPTVGEDVTKTVVEAMNQPPEVVELLRAAIPPK